MILMLFTCGLPFQRISSLTSPFSCGGGPKQPPPNNNCLEWIPRRQVQSLFISFELTRGSLVGVVQAPPPLQLTQNKARYK